MPTSEANRITIGWRGAVAPLIDAAGKLGCIQAASAMKSATDQNVRMESFRLCMDAYCEIVGRRQAACPSAEAKAIAEFKNIESRLRTVIWEIACGAP